MNFCPRCGSKLGMKLDGGRERPACMAEGCRFVHFGDFSFGCGAVVLRDGKALLIQRGINPNRGAWQIPGGYVEADEEIIPGVEREVLEEAGIVAKVYDVIGVRHALGTPTANIYVVFRLDLISGEPRYDGDETLDAGFFSMEEIGGMEQVQGFSLWSIQKAMELPRGAGMTLDETGLTTGRPGWSLFGVNGK